MALYIESWRYRYSSSKGLITTEAYNLWKLEDDTITKLGEYICWPFASEHDPNYWTAASSIIRKVVKNNGKLYKSQGTLNQGLCLKPLSEFPEAHADYTKNGVRHLFT